MREILTIAGVGGLLFLFFIALYWALKRKFSSQPLAQECKSRLPEPAMNDYETESEILKNHDQIIRINKKIVIARSADYMRKEFGSGKHGYLIGKKLSNQEIVEFEVKNSVILPEEFRDFLRGVGNGCGTSSSYRNSAAGPFYGIYDLKICYPDLRSLKNHLNVPCRIRPNMNFDEWRTLTESLQSRNLSDDEYSDVYNSILSGVLEIGTQGCSGCIGIIICGENVGRIVYFDQGLYDPPYFAEEGDFLNWYEAWLDRVISEAEIRPKNQID